MTPKQRRELWGYGRRLRISEEDFRGWVLGASDRFIGKKIGWDNCRTTDDGRRTTDDLSKLSCRAASGLIEALKAIDRRRQERKVA